MICSAGYRYAISRGTGEICLEIGVMLKGKFMEEQRIDGQWLGKFSGTNKGHVTLNLEIINNIYSGIVVLVDDAHDVNPWLLATVKIEIINGAIIGKLSGFCALDTQTYLPVEWQTIAHFYSNITLPSDGSLNGELNGNQFKGQWKTNIGTYGDFLLDLSEADCRSSRESTTMTWDEFKKFTSTLDKTKYIFRGQSKPWRLRTLSQNG
jgi:hypothetical protein